MERPKNQPLWTSVILHIVILLALFLATLIEAIKPKEKAHVFEMVAAPAPQASAAPAQPAPTLPDISLPDLAPVPEPVEQSAPPQPTPPQPETISYEDFLKTNPIPEPRTTPSPPRITAPRIDVPKLVLTPQPSPGDSSPRPLTQQEKSALDTYNAKLRSRIDVAWLKPGNLAGVKIAAMVVFDVSPSGRVSNVRLQRGSGNASFDQSVLAAFRKLGPAGPTPTGRGHRLTMTFRMTD